MDQLHQDRLQVAEGGSGLHAEAQLLLKVPPEGHLGREKVTEPSDLGVTDAAETFPRLTVRRKPTISRARDRFSSSRVRALENKEEQLTQARSSNPPNGLDRTKPLT